MPSNFFVNNLLAAMALTNDEPSVKKILCENCNNKDPIAESRCNECGIFLCQYCTECHKRYRSTEHHKLFSMEQLKSNPGPLTIAQKIRCQKHKEEIIKLFCKTCQTTICRDCTIVDHRQHDYGFVEEVALKEKQHLQSNLNEVKLRKGRVVLGIANLKEFNKNLEDKKNSTISEINQHFNELVKAAEFRKIEMIQKATTLTNSKQNQIRAQLEVLEASLATCESSIEFTELAFRNGNDVQILSMDKNILQSLQQLKVINDQTKPSVTEDMMFVIPFSVQETKNTLLNNYDVDVSLVSPENCHAYFNEVKTLLEQKKEESEIKEEKNYNEGEVVCDYPEDIDKEDWNRAEKFLEKGESVKKVETIMEKQVINENKCDGEHKAERFLGAGKQYSITLICKNRNYRKLRYGGQDVKPSFTGISVNDVSVTDNKDGSYTISFCPCQVGMLKFEVSINGTPAPNCTLEKQVSWRISDIYGKGVVTDGGMTMKGEGSNFCCRVGWCFFESGVHTWKVQLSNHDDSYNYHKNSSFEVGIIDHDKINADITISKNKWVFKHAVKHCHSDVLSLTLDMERGRLNVMFDSNRYYGPTVLRFTARRVLPFFACDSPNSSISLVE